jgi:cell division protein FtsN
VKRPARGWVALPLGLFLVLLWVAGCSVKRVPTHDPASPAPGKPYDYQGEAQSPPPPAVPAEAAGQPAQAPPDLETPQPASLGAPPVDVQDLPPSAPPSGNANAPAPAANPDDAGGSRYRVQVFASPDAEAAERVRAEIQARFGVPASVVFQAPYYKVRAGDCPTNDACRDLQEKLRGAGYDTVWITSDAAR